MGRMNNERKEVEATISAEISEDRNTNKGKTLVVTDQCAYRNKIRKI
jgi:hypothetical protein